ncbi:MAG: hypothetical protein ABIQ03_08030, partial [Burkholderiales bacterium]
MWDFITDLAGDVWDGISGFLSSIWNFTKWLVNRFIGIIEYIFTVLGIMLPKKFRIKVLILVDANLNPVAPIQDVEDAVALAKAVFKDEANVKLISAGSDRLSVGYSTVAPEYVQTVPCGVGAFLDIYTEAGRWFRRHSIQTPWGAFFGYGSPATIFVVKDVIDKDGCFLPFVTDYGYVDPCGLVGT